MTCRLEELLIRYPPEEVESKRFQKIAAALGNRTTLQVILGLNGSSYFIYTPTVCPTRISFDCNDVHHQMNTVSLEYLFLCHDVCDWSSKLNGAKTDSAHLNQISYVLTPIMTLTMKLIP